MKMHLKIIHKIRLLVVSWLAAPLAILLFMLFVNGCATTNQGQAIFNVPMHGNFCGPLHPAQKGTPLENIIELIRIKPFDDIDAACRRHDVCYEMAGYFDRTCDKWIISEVGRLKIIYTDNNHRMYCDNLQHSFIDPATIAYQRTPRARTGISVADATFDFIGQITHEAGGYIDAGFNMGLDHVAHTIDKGLGKNPKQCNNDNTSGGYNAPLANILFNDSLIEILQYQNYIDNTMASQLRTELGIDTQTSYAQRSGHTIQVNMQQWKDHPVLSGNWKNLR